MYEYIPPEANNDQYFRPLLLSKLESMAWARPAWLGLWLEMGLGRLWLWLAVAGLGLCWSYLGWVWVCGCRPRSYIARCV